MTDGPKNERNDRQPKFNIAPLFQSGAVNIPEAAITTIAKAKKVPPSIIFRKVGQMYIKC